MTTGASRTRRRGELAGRDAQRRLAAEAPAVDAGERIGERRGEAGELRRDIGAELAQQVGADHDHDAGEAGRDPGQRARR